MCILVAALVIGGALALSAAGLVFHRLDPLPTLPPSALLQVPIRLLGAIVVGIVVSTLLGSALVQRQTERANIAQVMRFAD